MHTFGDNELVFSLFAGGVPLGTLMSRAWFLGPLDLIANPTGLSGTYTGVGHGSPGSIPVLRLGPVPAGGTACATK